MLSEAPTVIVTVTVTLGVMAIVAVALRLYCRRLQKLRFGGDDYCIIIALVPRRFLHCTSTLTTCWRFFRLV